MTRSVMDGDRKMKRRRRKKRNDNNVKRRRAGGGGRGREGEKAGDGLHFAQTSCVSRVFKREWL